MCRNIKVRPFKNSFLNQPETCTLYFTVTTGRHFMCDNVTYTGLTFGKHSRKHSNTVENTVVAKIRAGIGNVPGWNIRMVAKFWHRLPWLKLQKLFLKSWWKLWIPPVPLQKQICSQLWELVARVWDFFLISLKFPSLPAPGWHDL